jgi:hypothetical protein
MPKTPSQIIAEIIQLANSVPTDPADYAQLSQHSRRQIREKLESALRRLDAVMHALDIARQPYHIFDPTDAKVVGNLVANTLLDQQKEPLSAAISSAFFGAGVYAIYYRGKFKAYRPIAGSENPIYVGKADPALFEAQTAREQGAKLFGRLKEHSKTIDSAVNLELDDFDCRHLVVRSAFIGTAENILIDWFKPVWNKEMKVCQGFGKHGDSPETRANKRSAWDTLHAGRAWAASVGNVPGKLDADLICAAIAKHFRKYPPKGKRA